MIANATRADLLRRALHASIDHDVAAAIELYTDDVAAWAPSITTSSRDELLANFERRDDAFSDVELEVTPLDVGGDYACAEWRVRMTHDGDLALRDGEVVPASGLRITLHGVTVAEFRGEQICSIRQYWDELSVYEQLGLAGDSP